MMTLYYIISPLFCKNLYLEDAKSCVMYVDDIKLHTICDCSA